MADDDALLDNELSAFVWDRKYRYAAETSVRDTWLRVAAAVAAVEPAAAIWRGRFLDLLTDFRFLPGGRILASAGTGLDATLCNCFVMGPIEDSIAGIFERLRESALTMQLGGGIGCDFSTLRPAGSRAKTSGGTASGPVSFLGLWDAMCSTLLAQGSRRGAMIGVLRCDHPDILEFVDAKRTPGTLTNFNLSVLVTDALVRAVDENIDVELVFPEASADPDTSMTGPPHAFGAADDPSTVARPMRAAKLWQHIVDAAYDTGEPGVLFVDRINEQNNLWYRERIRATNPCGEVPLPPFGACNLGSINLAAQVRSPFSSHARIDLDTIGALARDAVRFLDNVIDISRYPLAAQHAEAQATRRIGLGVTGLADALVMLGLRYDSEAARDCARTILTRIRDEAYAASIALAEEKGSFPAFDRDAYLAGNYISALPERLRNGIARGGIRNSHLLSIAPAGSISILANNVSSGIEPVFAPTMERTVLDKNGSGTKHRVVDHSCAVWARSNPGGVPPALVPARDVAPRDHLRMAAVLQPLVDNSISKTVNVAATISRDRFGDIYRSAFDLGLKGCTVFRANPVTGEIVSDATVTEQIRCCTSELATG